MRNQTHKNANPSSHSQRTATANYHILQIKHSQIQSQQRKLLQTKRTQLKSQKQKFLFAQTCSCCGDMSSSPKGRAGLRIKNGLVLSVAHGTIEISMPVGTFLRWGFTVLQKESPHFREGRKSMWQILNNALTYQNNMGLPQKTEKIVR